MPSADDESSAPYIAAKWRQLRDACMELEQVLRDLRFLLDVVERQKADDKARQLFAQIQRRIRDGSFGGPLRIMVGVSIPVVMIVCSEHVAARVNELPDAAANCLQRMGGTILIRSGVRCLDADGNQMRLGAGLRLAIAEAMPGAAAEASPAMAPSRNRAIRRSIERIEQLNHNATEGNKSR